MDLKAVDSLPPKAFDEFGDMHMAWVDKWRSQIEAGGYGNFTDLLALIMAWAEKHRIGDS